ncbi:MAG: tryptophan synthase subunit alpha [Lachnospiraceae bacterium]|nr:tryptophan synthase subunit alpha [Lachnospiraceae bacterium]
MSENRIQLQMKTLQDEGKKAFITYITAGLPDMGKTKEIIKAQEGITDVIELGIPFSDPTADGPVIQQASYEAIQAGASLRKSFSLMEELRGEGSDQPIVFMMYYNTIINYGIKEFADKCKSVGVDGLIVPDLPYEEQDALNDALKACGDATILIQLVSPISAERIDTITADAKGFIYCVSAMGVTGQGGSYHKDVTEYLKHVKSVSKIPVMMGFGIRTAADVAPMKDVIDGAIVGTHFINLMREADFNPQAATKYAEKFKKELNQLQ